MSSDKTFINNDTDDQMRIYGYSKCIWRTILILLFIILSVGLLLLIFYWKPIWFLKLTHVQVPLEQASRVLLKDKYNKIYIHSVHRCERIYFINKKLKYVWNEGKFDLLKSYEEQASESHFTYCQSLTYEEQHKRQILYGKNSIRIKLTPIVILLLIEVFSPFYIFQMFSCILWFNDSYYYFASSIVLLSTISIVYTLFVLRKNEKALREVVGKASKAFVYRQTPTGEQIQEVNEEELVPGDIIQLKNKTILQCDALLLSGNAILNESMLTGESVPVTKIPLVTSGPRKIDFKEHNRHIIFGGTHVLQTKSLRGEDVRAVVLRIGFSTSKGELVRAILYPKPADFKFNNDSYKYVGALAFIAGLGVIYSLTMKILYKNPPEDIVKRTLDIITIAVPPILPVALTTSLIFAQSRLKKQKIFCTSPRYINVSGILNTIVFDKTGTLTEDGMDIKCVLPKKNDHFGYPVYMSSDLSNQKHFLEAMATCHTITQIDDEQVGDPLDIKMLEFTKWTLDSRSSEIVFDYSVQTLVKSNDNELIGILRQFPFSSTLQRMSVIVTSGKTGFKLYAKGSPEKILELSRVDSIPNNFNQVLSDYTTKGYRVIAVAQRVINDDLCNVQKIDREKVECDLEFLGLLIMENRLKTETAPVIAQLKDAQIRVIMCTGDNLQTALCVSRECGMIPVQDSIVVLDVAQKNEPFEYSLYDLESFSMTSKNYHLAVTGKSFDIIRNTNKDLYGKLLVKGTVFSRMSPDQKQQLIESLQSLGYMVGMCGDGANDCGALRTSNAGISLSTNEASVASPFTSKIPNISCVPILIREGRCSLVSSMGIVKFIVMYSLVQFIAVLILYYFNAGLTDLEFLYADLVLTTLLSFFFTRTKAYSHLYQIPPPNKLIAWRPILSLFGHLLIVFGFQVFAVTYVTWQPWFEKYEDSDDKETKSFASYENTIVFCLSMFQYISMAIVFSKGEPYRKMIFTNFPFIVFLLMSTASSLVLTLVEDDGLEDFFTMRIIPDLKFRFVIVFMAILNFFVSFIFETYIIENDYGLLNVKENKNSMSNCSGKLLEYQKIEMNLRAEQDWPPIFDNMKMNQIKTRDEEFTQL